MCFFVGCFVLFVLVAFFFVVCFVLFVGSLGHHLTMEHNGKPWKTMENHVKQWETLDEKPWVKNKLQLIYDSRRAITSRD